MFILKLVDIHKLYLHVPVQLLSKESKRLAAWIGDKAGLASDIEVNTRGLYCVLFQCSSVVVDNLIDGIAGVFETCCGTLSKYTGFSGWNIECSWFGEILLIHIAIDC